jgi:hypothetical protein
MNDWDAFYNRQRTIALENAELRLKSERIAVTSSTEAEWKACIEAQSSLGRAPETIKCKIEHQPSRAALDRISTPSRRIVVHKTVVPDDYRSGDVGYTVWTLLVARPGLAGVWDRLWDHSKK